MAKARPPLLQVRLVLLPEERAALHRHLMASAIHPSLSPGQREVARIASRLFAGEGREITLRLTPETFRTLLPGLLVDNGLPVTSRTIDHLTRAKDYVAGTIQHELARVGLT